MNAPSQRVLVTGSAGRLGRAVVAELLVHACRAPLVGAAASEECTGARSGTSTAYCIRGGDVAHLTFARGLVTGRPPKNG
jgi:uncharacterized protein YbjT (DUF2867 family)